MGFYTFLYSTKNLSWNTSQRDKSTRVDHVNDSFEVVRQLKASKKEQFSFSISSSLYAFFFQILCATNPTYNIRVSKYYHPLQSINNTTNKRSEARRWSHCFVSQTEAHLNGLAGFRYCTKTLACQTPDFNSNNCPQKKRSFDFEVTVSAFTPIRCTEASRIWGIKHPYSAPRQESKD